MTVMTPITPERWRQVYAAFSAVLDQEPAHRAVYLARAFGDDAVLRDEVKRLISDAETAESQGFLQAPAWIIDDIPFRLPDFRNGNSEYSQIEYIGHGGMGIVYKAYNNGLDKWVALKLSSPVHLGTTRDRDRFRNEAQNMARLNHPNIVRVLSTGEYEGRPYFEMELIQGKEGQRSLNDQLPHYLERPQRAAEFVEAVALAVHHAHQRRVLHNDLKPANILLDEEGQPYVTDFGLAKRVGEDAVASATGAIEGTASYMSPEQAEAKEITTVSDVYGLGALLYTLITGEPPFRGGTVPETLQLVRTAIPKPPRALNPNVDKTLEAICLKCLNKDPAQRYASANAVAQDLIRYRTGKETHVDPWSRRERVVSWSRRNVVEAGLVTAVITIWIFAVVMAWNVAGAREEQLVEAAKAKANSTAMDLATASDLQLGNLSRHAERAAADPRLAGFVAQNNRNALQQIVVDLCSAEPVLFETCYMTNQNGIQLAHFPSADTIGADFSWRDYFRGAKRLGLNGISESYISQVYRGTSDDLYKFAISTPIRDRQNHFLGIIVASVTTDASLGPVIPHDGRKAALIAPEEIGSASPAPESRIDRYRILFHPAYQKGDAPIEFPYVDKIRMRPIPPDDHYIDPVLAGRWIAGFAAVPNTPFLFIVQQPYDEAVSLETSTLWTLALWSALASIVAVAILVMVLWRWARSRRGEAH